ncbi:hypothetical protein [Yoonia litorea]|uniref:Uncharacterized protein n=1 Tax=Yoonia litorea TaxID=1123755 RepID=A0A1I6MXK0_9RHOB|nr:hypothetical protein [Yoonia litorea]SFS20278.1 hypothetical protein SAMN05444714_2561 [Yoonia litorea]
MVISIIEVSNRRVQLLKSKALNKLKEQRKTTRSVMQSFEGSNDLGTDTKSTYDHLNTSMVVLNGLRDHLTRYDCLPHSWDELTLGSEFAEDATPLLRTGEDGELWVEFYEFEKPKDLMIFLAGAAVAGLYEQAQKQPGRPAPAQPKPAQKPKAASNVDGGLMDMIRNRMPNRENVRYSPQRG